MRKEKGRHVLINSSYVHDENNRDWNDTLNFFTYKSNFILQKIDNFISYVNFDNILSLNIAGRIVDFIYVSEISFALSSTSLE